MSEETAAAEWKISRAPTPLVLTAALEPPSVTASDWRPLRRHAKADASAAKAFNPGWARLQWTPAALAVDFVFLGERAHNAATTLNQRTHELGDVAELFLQWPEVDRYIELHVTPENQLLQLAWTTEALAAVRAGKRTLEERVVADPSWVQSRASVAKTFWSARMIVPPKVVAPELKAFRAGLELRTSMCRYDYSLGRPPVLSSIVDYRGGRFHEREAWQRIVLVGRGVPAEPCNP